MDSSEVKEIVQSAGKYLISLKELEGILNNAEHQIKASSKATNYTINKHFDKLKLEIDSALDKRKNVLLKFLSKIKEESLKPINDSQKLITDKIDTTNGIIELGDQILKSPDDSGDCSLFNKASNELHNLPEVPELKYVPSISFMDNFAKEHHKYVESLSIYGSISKIAPVQIGLAVEKPGGLLLKFKNTDEDNPIDISEYRLQMAKDNVIGKPNIDSHFKDIYIGTDDEIHVKKLIPYEQYSFRVCCKLITCHEWSPWSAIEVTSTKLEPYEWQQNGSFILSEMNTIARPSSNMECSICSNSLTIMEIPEDPFNSVEFVILDVGLSLENNFLGLKSCETSSEPGEFKNAKGTILVEMTGDVYMDGVKKTTKLDTFRHGSKLIFTYNISNESLCVHIDSNDKRITYFWNIPTKYLSFGAAFTSNQWKVMVQ